MTSYLTLPVTRIGSEGDTDQVVIEEPLEIRINGKNIAITMRTPGNDEELAAGFLFTEGLIKDPKEILNIKGGDVELATQPITTPRLTMTSACGVCGKESVESLYVDSSPAAEGFTVSADILCSLPNKLRAAQKVFEETGGLHAAALFDNEGNLKLIREDVGRHNAVDKLVGQAILSPVQPSEARLSQSVILVSGRASFELIQKAAVAGIPLLAAVGAPSTLAIETAKKYNMTLVGFLKENRLNIYANPDRIKSNPHPKPNTTEQHSATPASATEPKPTAPKTNSAPNPKPAENYPTHPHTATVTTG